MVLGSAVDLRTKLPERENGKNTGGKTRDFPPKIVTKLHISQEKVRAHVLYHDASKYFYVDTSTKQQALHPP